MWLLAVCHNKVASCHPAPRPADTSYETCAALFWPTDIAGQSSLRSPLSQPANFAGSRPLARTLVRCHFKLPFHSCVGPLLSLQVYVDVEDRNEWRECFDVGGVKLPTGLYFGASAVTGQLAGKCNSCTSAWLRILCLSSHTVASFQKPSFPMEFKYSWFSNPDISPFSWDSQFLDLDITEFVISGIPFQIHGSYFWSFLSATFTNINYPTTSMVLVVFWDHHSSSCNSNIKCLLHCISLPKLLNDNEIMFFSYGTCLLELKKEQNIVWMLFILQTTMT